MNFLDKVKTGHSLFISIAFHVLVLAMILKIFSSEDAKVSLADDIKPVAVISGSEFEALKAKFSKKQKETVVKKYNANSKISLNQNNKKQSRFGSKTSKLNDGLKLKLSKSGSNFDNSYVNIIANKIEQMKSSINMASAPSDVQTQITIKVKLNDDGDLTSYKVVQNSDYKFFNRAAVKIVELSAPFPKPPVDNSNREFSIPIIFDTA